MKTKASIVALFLTFLALNISAQSNATLLIISNQEARVLIDGDSLGVISANQPKKFEISSGEYYLQVITIGSNKEKSEIFSIEAGQQSVKKIEFDITDINLGLSNNKILVADIDFNIPGLATLGAAEAAEEDFEYPTYYFAFQKGDEVIINLDMSNKNGTNIIEVFTYPDLNVIYSNDNFKDLKDHKISINKESIYGFTFATKHVFDRDVRFKLERIVGDESSTDFNTSVEWVESYEVRTIQEAQEFYINATMNETLSDGNSRTVIPLNFPENTVKWFYEFSAFKEKEALDRVYNSFNLAAELSRLIDQTGVLSFGISQLSQPPGSDYCHVYFLDYENLTLFNSREAFSYIIEGSRQNYKSGIVEVNYVPNDETYLGIENTVKLYGINVAIQVVAIVKQSGLFMQEYIEN